MLEFSGCFRVRSFVWKPETPQTCLRTLAILSRRTAGEMSSEELPAAADCSIRIKQQAGGSYLFFTKPWPHV